jgi:hypothetical protein
VHGTADDCVSCSDATHGASSYDDDDDDDDDDYDDDGLGDVHGDVCGGADVVLVH